jgi:hypothetical protein
MSCPTRIRRLIRSRMAQGFPSLTPILIRSIRSLGLYR